MNKIEEIIKNALLEDMPSGDITTDSIIPEKHQSKAYFIAKEDGVISGLNLVDEVYKQVGGNYKLSFNIKNGDSVKKGDVFGIVEGDTRTILKAERLSLNLLQRMSGIATLTNEFVKQIPNSCKILDTRKTTPNLRIIERQAVRDGGGFNHRFCLSDMILIKDNHIDAAGSITSAVKLARKAHPNINIEVEVETIEQLEEALKTDCNIIMLDNMSTTLMETCVKINKGHKLLEASGNMSVGRVKEVATTGVNFISVGALTHSAKALDISLKFHLLNN